MNKEKMTDLEKITSLLDFMYYATDRNGTHMGTIHHSENEETALKQVYILFPDADPKYTCIIHKGEIN